MNAEKFSISSCCGKSSTIYKIDRPITRQLIDQLIALGFSEEKSFTSAGILYMLNPNFILNGPIGQNKIQVKARKKESNFEEVEALFKTIT